MYVLTLSLNSDILARLFCIVNEFLRGARMQRLGAKIRTLRRRRRLTLQELALALGFSSHSYVSEIERGKKVPTIEMIIKIADVFGVSVDELVRDDLEVDPK
jgi:transcriptional regulator with XRE-family HTH domain